MIYLRTLRFIALLVASLCSGMTSAQNYPSKHIHILSPTPPGGSNDMLARLLADKMQHVLGTTVIVENKPGASGTTAVKYIMEQPGDGYTLLLANNAIAINPLLTSKARYDPRTDLVPIAQIGRITVIIGGRLDLPFDTLAGLVTYAKSHPGQLSYASCGTGTVPHLAGEVFKRRTGIDMIHVPYKGCGDSIANVIGGQVDVTFSTMPALLKYVEQKRVKGYAIASEQRISAAKSLPTVAESGYPGYAFALWHGLMAPKNTPAPIVERLNSAINQVLQDPSVRQQLAMQGVEPTGGTPATLAKIIASDLKTYGEVIRETHINLD